MMMPFGPMDRPSLGLSLLAQCLNDAGLPAKVLYPNLDLEQRLGESFYKDMSSSSFNGTLAGEWLFSRVLEPIGSADDFVQSLAKRYYGGVVPPDSALARLVAALPNALAEANALIERWSDAVLRLKPSVIGLSSCYHQHLACLAMAKQIKEKCPSTLVILGGTNCNDPMGAETFRQFSFLDAVVVGPGEVVFVDLVRRHLAGTRNMSLPGVYWRSTDGRVSPDPPTLVAPEPDLNALPMPFFDDFFDAWKARVRQHPQDSDQADSATVPIETSRGCWWGQKQHCVFCSENAHSMHYRPKIPDRVFAEFEWLLNHYPDRQISATDEILDFRLIDTVMPRLADLPGKRRIFFSLKANIRKTQLAKLVAAGVTSLQPGIESFADEILRPMKKGVSGLQNIQLLKWCREFGIKTTWAIIYGFPFEAAESYDRMTALIPLLTHLEPPTVNGVSLQRFSPLYEQAERFGVRDIVPDESYRLIYRAEEESLRRLAYQFEYNCARSKPLAEYTQPLRMAAKAWKSTAADAFLVYHDQDGRLTIGDTRPAARRRIHCLSGTARAAYLACDEIKPRHAIARDLVAGLAVDDEKLTNILEELVADGLMLTDKGLYLSLAVRIGRRSLPPVSLMADILTTRNDRQTRASVPSLA
jgi:ribosomal peptide maturation radical SAM protein 1